ncbi:MAG: hypothetical protein H6581_11670 [Bacteroidia bacterium]|nr:hypothetical protein [Bacteroidia bacterium]
MKHLRFLLTFALLLTLGHSLVLAGGLKLKEGSRLIYWVDYYGSKYDFEVTIRSIGEEGIKFDYHMTVSGTKGSVEITASALQNALGQVNNFSGGELILSTKTTVWVSRTVYSGLKKAKSVNIDLGEGTEALVFKKNADLDVKVDDKVKNLKVIEAETDEGHKYTILDDKKFPLILKMDLGWMIGIKEVKP